MVFVSGHHLLEVPLESLWKVVKLIQEEDLMTMHLGCENFMLGHT